MVQQPGLGALPMSLIPGLGAQLAPAPGIGQHTTDILAEIGATA
jgi:hypothetical protein